MGGRPAAAPRRRLAHPQPRVEHADEEIRSEQEPADDDRRHNDEGRQLERVGGPNSLGTILVAATSVAGQSIVLVATVDYLGYGFNEYTRPTLGGLLAVAARGILVPGRFSTVESQWWLFVLPVVLLVPLLACLNLFGDALDAINPRAA